LFRVLLKRKWIIIGATLIAAFVAIWLTRNEPHKYRSLAQVSTGFTVSDEIRINNENFSFFEADVKFNNAIVTFTSPTVLSLLSYDLILHDLKSPNPFRYLSKQEQQIPLYQKIDKQKAAEVFRRKLETMSLLSSFKDDEKDLLELLGMYGYDYKSLNNNLTVARLQRTDYIQVEFESENPELSAYVVNDAFQQFLRYYKSVRSSRSLESIDTLQSLLDKRKQELDEKNAALRNAGIIDVGQENSSKLEQMMSLETTLTEEQSKQTNIQYSIQKVNQRLARLGVRTESTDPVSTAPDTENEQILLLRQQMNDAYLAYKNSGSSDPALLKKYETLKSQYQDRIATSTGSSRSSTTGSSVGAAGEDKASLLEKKSDLEVDLKASSANIEAIQNKINNLKGNLVKDASKGAVVDAMLKEAELANKEYIAAKQKYSDAIDITTSSVNNFRQILQGQPAIEPEPSKRKLVIGMAAMSAFTVTVLIIISLTYLDSSIKTPQVFARIVNLRMISTVNLMNLKKKKLSSLITELDTTPDELANKRHNVFREALRKLRFELETSGKKTFLFASTKKGEGKTTLIQALAYSMSLSKKKILIIDTNFCNNDLTLQLNADPILEKIHPDKLNPRGLIDQVKYAAKPVEDSPYIFVIGSEGGDYTPSEILPRENLLHHLQALTAEFDYIFLEGPPLNDFTDTKELAHYVDGVIAVFSATHIIKQVDKQSLTFFHELNGKFCGAVLNMVNPENVNAS
jgi:Mrp family chromosome partitioning ATPase/uncharacterized protein involved in exopolysaccharide biosynthesis